MIKALNAKPAQRSTYDTAIMGSGNRADGGWIFTWGYQMSLQVFGEFGIVGPSNTTPSPFQDRQLSINWYPEISPSQTSKTATALLCAPGLIQIAAAPGGGAPGFDPLATTWPQPSAVTNLPVRGMWVLPGRTTALVVISNKCYLARVITYGSRTVAGSFSLTSVGNP